MLKHFDPTTPDGVPLLCYDLSAELARPGAAVLTIQSVTARCEVHSGGDDVAAASRLIGGTFVHADIASLVCQKFAGGVLGVTYAIVFAVVYSDGSAEEYTGLLPVRRYVS